MYLTYSEYVNEIKIMSFHVMSYFVDEENISENDFPFNFLSPHNHCPRSEGKAKIITPFVGPQLYTSNLMKEDH